MTLVAALPPIRIAAALIEDGQGRMLMVRKTGTRWFMQAGGKIEAGESAVAALKRELFEEIGLPVDAQALRPLGRYSALAANEPGQQVDADVFHLRVTHRPVATAEIAEAVWVDLAQAETMPLAPLTQDHILPLWRAMANPASAATPPPTPSPPPPRH